MRNTDGICPGLGCDADDNEYIPAACRAPIAGSGLPSGTASTSVPHHLCTQSNTSCSSSCRRCSSITLSLIILLSSLKPHIIVQFFSKHHDTQWRSQ